MQVIYHKPVAAGALEKVSVQHTSLVEAIDKLARQLSLTTDSMEHYTRLSTKKAPNSLRGLVLAVLGYKKNKIIHAGRK